MLEAVTGADAAVIVTEWDEFRGLASPPVREAMAQPLIVDGRNLLDPAAARAAGFAYESVGRPSDPDDVARIVAPGSVTPGMIAVVLVGGLGTRLRPLTLTDAQGDAADRQPAVSRAPARAPGRATGSIA